MGFATGNDPEKGGIGVLLVGKEGPLVQSGPGIGVPEGAPVEWNLHGSKVFQGKHPTSGVGLRGWVGWVRLSHSGRRPVRIDLPERALR